MNEIRLAPNTSVCVLGWAASAKSPELNKAIIKSTMSRNKRKFEFLFGGRVWSKQSAQVTRSLDAH